MRPSKHEYYMNISKAVLERSTCLRKRFGAVIVLNDEIVGTGYNGAPRGHVNCCDIGTCYRKKLNIKHGQHYELCKAIHAENNAIISAGRTKCIGSTLYIAGFDVESNKPYPGEPCWMCARLVLNSGISQVLIEEDGVLVSVSNTLENKDSNNNGL